MAMLAHEGSKRYKEVFDLVHRREAAKPNETWQADHTLLDLWVLTPSGRPGRPWLTLIEDDHSRAIAGYAVNLGAPTALTTALAFRQAIWRKPWPGWHVCGASPDLSRSLRLARCCQYSHRSYSASSAPATASGTPVLSVRSSAA
jgi:transposase InsO family protein